MNLELTQITKNLATIKSETTIEPFPIDGRAVSEIVFNTSLSDDEVNAILTEAKNIVGSIEGSAVGDFGTPIIAIGVNAVMGENALQDMMTEHFATSTEPFNLHLMIMIKRITTEDLQRAGATEEELEQFTDKPMIMSMSLCATIDGISGLASDVIYYPNMTDSLLKRINGIPEEMSYEEYVAMAAQQGVFMDVTGPGWNKNIVNNNGIYKCFFPVTMSWDNYKNGETMSGKPFVFDMPAANKVLEPLANLGGTKGVSYTLVGDYTPIEIRLNTLSDIDLYNEYIIKKEMPIKITANKNEVFEPYTYTIDENVSSIASYTYKNIKGVKAFILPEGVTSIGDYAFYNCSLLEQINIPENVVDIGDFAFSLTPRLTSFNINRNNFNNLGQESLEKASSCNLTEITVNNSIKERALHNWNNLEKITIPYVGIEEPTDELPTREIIGDMKYMFGMIFGEAEHEIEGTTNVEQYQYWRGSASMASGGRDYKFNMPNKLKEIVIKNDTLRYLPAYSFSKLPIVEKITLNTPKLEYIGADAFWDCVDLKEIYVPGSVRCFYTNANTYRSESGNAIRGCNKLETITTDATNSWNKVYNGFLYTAERATIGNYQVIEGSQSNYYLTWAPIINTTTELNNFLEGVVGLSAYCFYNNPTVEKVILPDSLKHINTGAFYKCANLKEVTIPSSVSNIEEFSFRACNNLAEIYYKGTLEDWCNIRFGEDRFGNEPTASPLNGNGELSVYNENNEWYKPTEIIPTILKDSTFSYCKQLTKVDLSNFNSIPKWSFFRCSGLKEVIFSESLTEIKKEAFEGCSSLKWVVIPESTTTMGYRVFENCTNLTIFCEANIQPSGWASGWNDKVKAVYWSGQWEYDENNIPKPII